jgi:hypothetical protein
MNHDAPPAPGPTPDEQPDDEKRGPSAPTVTYTYESKGHFTTIQYEYPGIDGNESMRPRIFPGGILRVIGAGFRHSLAGASGL